MRTMSMSGSFVIISSTSNPVNCHPNHTPSDYSSTLSLLWEVNKENGMYAPYCGSDQLHSSFRVL
jgi:hypothetical protein